MPISKAKFKEAFREVISSEFSHIPKNEDEIDFEFSERFNKRMTKLINSQKKAYYYLINTAAKRVAIIFVLILTMFTAAFSVKAIREPIIEFVKQIYETFIHYSVEGDTTDKITKEYTLSKLPEGFDKTDIVRNDYLVTTIYENTSGDIIEFTQATTKYAQIHIDNEKESIYVDKVNDIELNINETLDIKQIFWLKNSYYFDITCYGDISLDTIKQMIISIEYD